MSNSRLLYWLAQVVGWTSYGALIFLATYADEPQKVDWILITNIISLIVFGILGTHLMRGAYLRMGWLELKLTPLIPRVILASLICSVFISFSTTVISLLIDEKEKDNLTFLLVLIKIFAILVLVLFWNAIYYTFHFFQKSRNQELDNITLEASRNEIELKNLRSQLNPHFLFNSLNSIRALIDIEPMKAKESVTTLSNLLRSSLVMGKEDLVTLQDELEMVSNYLELEKIRFEERLNVKWDLDETLKSFQLPPFSLQMLVENAIKHGISNLVHGGEIMIRTEKRSGDVVISVANSGELSDKVDTGIGLANTRRRLDLQFKGKAEFELVQEGEKVVARLIFKQE